MKHTNKMVNIESNPLNGSSFMNDLRNEYMEKQTAVEWLVEQYTQGNYSWEVYEQAKEMEKEQIMNSFADGFVEGVETQKSGEQLLFPEQYYNETFNTNKK
jgi:hypothetical protein